MDDLSNVIEHGFICQNEDCEEDLHVSVEIIPAEKETRDSPGSPRGINFLEDVFCHSCHTHHSISWFEENETDAVKQSLRDQV